MTKFVETFVDYKGHIFLLSNDRSILEATGKTLCEYAKNSYPSTTPGEVVIQRFNSEQFQKVNYQPFPDGLERLEAYLSRNDRISTPETAREWTKGNMFHKCHRYYESAKQILDQNYTYSLNLDLILPSIVKTILDISHRHPDTAMANALNCHGGALVASGIFPMTEFYEHPIYCENVPDGVHSVSFEELMPGDIITLARSGRDYDHSIVYLTDDLCISVNGRRNTMGIYAVKEIINNYIPEIQYNSPKDLSNVASFYRKNTALQYSESIFDLIRECYFLQASCSWCIAHSVCDDMTDRLKKLSCLLIFECLSTNIPKKWHKKIRNSLCMVDGIQKIFRAMDAHKLTREECITMLENPDSWKPPDAIATTASQRFFLSSPSIKGAILVAAVAAIGLGMTLSS